jgi:leader peptidase (prepilin peptidase) / N-methyltransferase
MVADILLLNPMMLAAGAFVVGMCIGSFLNVCIARWPAGLSVVSPPSRCPQCERPIRAYENLPVVGWLSLRGRCAGCQGAISIQYPLVELAIGVTWAAVIWRYGVTFTALRLAIFVTLLAGVAITDLKHYLIPDGFTVFGLVWVVTTAFLALFLSPPPGDTLFAAPYDALIGACTGAGAIAIAGWIGEVALKREAMGFGDVTLMAVAGAALGPNRALLTIFIAAGIGVVVFLGVVYPTVWLLEKRRGTASELPLVPFGVFLAPAAIVALLYGDTLVHWYVARFLGA